MVVSRASTAIFLILNNTKLRGTQVLVPSNLCYAGIYPVQYSGLTPVFCDVDPVRGNVTYETVFASMTSQIGAMIIPHMYGNPVLEMPKIAELCKNRGILLIEDCASAMGAHAADYIPGTMGDYSVYSTGYSKTLDLGYGGLLVSHIGSVSRFAKQEKHLPVMTDEMEQNLALFSRLYRLLRNEGGDLPLTRMIYSGIPGCCRTGFIHTINDEKKANVINALQRLDRVIDSRRGALADYSKALGALSKRIMYPYEPGAVPWRLNLIIEDASARAGLIKECLRLHLPVSDWYPTVTPMFNVKGDFDGAIWHERHILNFPLMIDEKLRERIVDTILKFL